MTVLIDRFGPGEGSTVAAILADLPAWFGRPEANAEYIAAAERMPAYVATATDGERVGVLLVEQHFPETAEIHLMAVRRHWHRRGVGRSLLARVEEDARAAGTRMITVKTLGSADPDEGYRRTRLFYAGMGFVRLEEFTDLWPGTGCLFLAKSLD